MIRIIGDVHGKVKQFLELLEPDKLNIQVGDLSINIGDYLTIDNYIKKYAIQLRVVMGNHDNYQNVQFFNNFLLRGLGTMNKQIGYFSGAYSIDKHLRVENVNWFKEEELNYSEINERIKILINQNPTIMISHDCPQSICEQEFGFTDKTMTRQALELIKNEITPHFWFYGHHHKSSTITVNGTQFICLSELEFCDI